MVFPMTEKIFSEDEFAGMGCGRYLTITISALSMLLLSACFSSGSDIVRDASFDPAEATIDDIQAAYDSGILTSVELVQYYLDRISVYLPWLKKIPAGAPVVGFVRSGGARLLFEDLLEPEDLAVELDEGEAADPAVDDSTAEAEERLRVDLWSVGQDDAHDGQRPRWHGHP